MPSQVLALKEALALAAVLDWTVASFGFWPHSSEVAAAEKAAAAGAARDGGAGGGGAGRGGGVAGAGPGALAAAAALAPIIPFDLVFSRWVCRQEGRGQGLHSTGRVSGDCQGFVGGLPCVPLTHLCRFAAPAHDTRPKLPPTSPANPCLPRMFTDFGNYALYYCS